jgi:predicted AlkP superfamily phosphohydrolase/phosphomutase
MKLLIIGLDSAVPDLVFNKWMEELPNLKRLMEKGTYGPLESTHPPITVPAWASMMSSKDPGQLGYYGFRNRKDYSYDGYTIANSTAVRYDRAWDKLSDAGKKVILLGVPQTYPTRRINGCIVTDFLTPSTKSEYTYPSELKDEIEKVSGGYVLDVENFRTEDKDALLERIYEKTRKHFKVAKHLISTKPWDFFMVVEMGVDRIQHGFWSYMDPEHHKYRAGNPFENAIKEYYRFCDREIGDLLSLVSKETIVMVVSDHGARKMDGGICFNEWLIKEGYLTLKEYPSRPTSISDVEIDWNRTMAWGDGGYYGRLFMNVKGREPQGIINPKDYERIRSELIERIEAIEDPGGKNIGSRAYRPEDLYREVNGVAPDLIVYFGNLDWRSVGSVGLRSIYTFENDTGPDEANHDWQGVFILNEMGCRWGNLGLGYKEGLRIYDIGPTVLSLFGVKSKDSSIGKSLIRGLSQLKEDFRDDERNRSN